MGLLGFEPRTQGSVAKNFVVSYSPVPFIYSSRDDLLEVAPADFCHS